MATITPPLSLVQAAHAAGVSPDDLRQAIDMVVDDPAIMNGVTTIRGTRIPVHYVGGLREHG